jgi:hypothetical protein
MVDLLQYSSQGIEPVGSSFDEDLALLDAVKRSVEFQSTQQGGSIAKQGLHITNALATFLQDDLDGADNPAKSATLFVPYFGTISVQSGASIRRPNGARRAQPFSLSTLPSRAQSSAASMADEAQLKHEIFPSCEGVDILG